MHILVSVHNVNAHATYNAFNTKLYQKFTKSKKVLKAVLQ